VCVGQPAAGADLYAWQGQAVPSHVTAKIRSARAAAFCAASRSPPPFYGHADSRDPLSGSAATGLRTRE
jgi:hypothetical protein